MKHLSIFYLLPVMVFAILISCGQASKPPVKGPKGFNWNEPEKFFLRETLQEISGIAFHPDTDTLLYAVNDEEGKLFTIRLSDTKEKMPHVKFGKQNDYEDLAWWQNQWWVLQSNGSIHRTGLSEDSTKVFENLLPPGEYETMAASGAALYVACKQCKQDNEVPVYRLAFDSSGTLTMTEKFLIDDSAVRKFSGKEKFKFRPAAMAWHPAEKQWFIVSANDRLLVTTDDRFNVTGAWPLPARLFPQPEGIAISPSGNLYISNEGSESTATLLKYSYMSPAKQ